MPSSVADRVPVATDDLPPGLIGSVGESLLWVEELTKEFRSHTALSRSTDPVRAVTDVSFNVLPTETFGLVGESGSGKTTISRCIVGLTSATSGRIFFEGSEISRLPHRELQRTRRRLQIVFQDTAASLDPRMNAAALIEEPLAIHNVGNRAERRKQVRQLMDLVSLSAEHVHRKPHEFSGGQRQRIALARALALNPRLIVLDEPVSALDVSVQAQVLNLLRSLRTRLSLSYLFIIHDLAVAEYFCDRVAVLFLGRVMELGSSDDIFRAPVHPYTKMLIASAPVPDPARSRHRGVSVRDITPGGSVGRGCVYRERCSVGQMREVCATISPPLTQTRPGHWTACHFATERSGDVPTDIGLVDVPGSS